MPSELMMPDTIDNMLKAAILPRANSLLRIGVNNIKAKVPLSFSPAIASGQTVITSEKSIEIVNRGNIKAITCINVESFLPTLGVISFPSTIFSK